MENLELKHLAPYLPYDIRVEVKCDEEVYKSTLVGFGYFDKELHALCGNKINNGLYHINGEEYIKPILRPLSDLTKDNWKWEIQQLYPCDLIFTKYDSGNENECDFTFSVSYQMMGDSFTDTLVMRGSVEESSYSFIQFLLKNHFDIFGLIGKGLAIDINTLNQ